MLTPVGCADERTGSGTPWKTNVCNASPVVGVGVAVESSEGPVAPDDIPADKLSISWYDTGCWYGRVCCCVRSGFSGFSCMSSSEPIDLDIHKVASSSASSTILGLIVGRNCRLLTDFFIPPISKHISRENSFNLKQKYTCNTIIHVNNTCNIITHWLIIIKQLLL